MKGFSRQDNPYPDFDALCSAVSATKSAPIATIKADGSETAPRDYQDKLLWHAHQFKNSKNVDKKILGVELGEVVRFDSTVTLVDALNLDAALAESPIAADQIRAVDVIVLNKRDLVDDARLEAVRCRVLDINPRAPQFCTRQGDFNPALIFDVDDATGLDRRRKKSVADPCCKRFRPCTPRMPKRAFSLKALRFPVRWIVRSSYRRWDRCHHPFFVPRACSILRTPIRRCFSNTSAGASNCLFSPNKASEIGS